MKPRIIQTDAPSTVLSSEGKQDEHQLKFTYFSRFPCLDYVSSHGSCCFQFWLPITRIFHWQVLNILQINFIFIWVPRIGLCCLQIHNSFRMHWYSIPILNNASNLTKSINMAAQLLVWTLLASRDYQLVATFWESFLNFEKSSCSWPSEMSNPNKILKDMDLIYFSRMKMKRKWFFFSLTILMSTFF